jgi:ABC-type branched-subunit amino acid transport system substrate-binding protein
MGGYETQLHQSALPKRELNMLKRIIYHMVVLAGHMVVLTCLAHSTEPLKIGMVAPLTGSAAELGRYEIQGAKLAAEEVNKAGGVLGRPIELVIEDDQTTNPGVVLAFSTEEVISERVSRLA